MNPWQVCVRAKSIISFLPIFGILLVIACNQKQEIDSETYFQPYFNNYNLAQESEKLIPFLAMDSAFYAFSKPSTIDRLKRYAIKLDYYNHAKKDYKTALLYTDSITALAQKHLDNKDIASEYIKALETKGSINIHQKIYDEGFKFLAESKNAADKYMKDSCGTDRSNVIPDILFSQSRYDLAIRYYQSSLAISLQCQPLTFERFALAQNSLNSLGLCYLNLQKKDSATLFLDSALSFIAHSRPLFPKNSFLNLAAGVVYNTKGYLEEASNNFNIAEGFYLQSIEMVEKDYPRFALDTRFSLCNSYMKNGQLVETKKMLAVAEPLLPIINIDDAYSDFYSIKSQYFEETHNYDSALANFKLHSDLKGKIAAKSKEWSQFNVEKEVQTKQTQLKNDILQKDVSIKKFQLTVTILLFVLALGAAGSTWNYYRRSARHVKELEALTVQISQNHEQLQKSFASLEQSHAENKALLRIVAHDLKNPISGIQMLARSVKNVSDNTESKSSMDLIGNACKSLLETINDMLSNQNDLSEQHKELVDLGWLLENCTQLLQTKASEKDQKLSLTAKPILVKVNREKIWRVMSNLIHNAIKFSAKGSEICLKLVRKDDNVLLSVKDHGIGIPGDLQNKIFTMDDRSKSRPGTMGEESHGLGLAIVKKIVEEHGGNIWFESMEGKGTVFYVSLPLQTTG